MRLVILYDDELSCLRARQFINHAQWKLRDRGLAVWRFVWACRWVAAFVVFVLSLLLGLAVGSYL